MNSQQKGPKILPNLTFGSNTRVLSQRSQYKKLKRVLSKNSGKEWNEELIDWCLTSGIKQFYRIQGNASTQDIARRWRKSSKECYSVWLISTHAIWTAKWANKLISDQWLLMMALSSPKGATALFDMIEFYESASHLCIANNKSIGVMGWQALCRTLKRVKISFWSTHSITCFFIRPLASNI